MPATHETRPPSGEEPDRQLLDVQLRCGVEIGGSGASQDEIVRGQRTGPWRRRRSGTAPRAAATQRRSVHEPVPLLRSGQAGHAVVISRRRISRYGRRISDARPDSIAPITGHGVFCAATGVVRAVRWRNPSDRAATSRATRVPAPPAGSQARGVVDGVVGPEQGAAPHGRRPALNPLPRSGPGKTKSCLECAPGGRASPAFPRNLLETRAGRLTERILAESHGWAETGLPDSAVRTAAGRR